jgi:uncharacterized protein YndB with AHSA1/START domain
VSAALTPMARTATPATMGTRRTLDDGRVALRFERPLAHPPDRVWRAITDEAQLATWFPAVVDLDQPAGTELTFRPTDEQRSRFDLPEPTTPNGEITKVDRPRLLEYDWDDEDLRWEIEPDGDGSRLVFTNIVKDHGTVASIAAGWHASLEVLEAQLDGHPVNWSAWDRAEALNEPYEKQVG